MSKDMGRYIKYTGQETEVCLSVNSQGMPLSVIGSKAFLSCKTVERLVLPPTLEVVEDWGFAHMKNLREIVLPAREIRFGRQVFLGCDSLQRVVLYSVKDIPDAEAINYLEELPGLDRLRASMFRFFPQESLEQLEYAVEEAGQRKWLALYDGALESFLREPDDNGFEPAFIGWFDVEDVDDQRQGYILSRRKNKIMLAFERLICGEEPFKHLQQYLWSVILDHGDLVQELFLESSEYGRDIRYYKIWQQAGGLSVPVAEILLTKLPWEEPEIRANLMELLQQERKEDFFTQLEL